MERFAQWVEDWRWAANARRARAWRRELSFSRRQEFDHALRPKIKGEQGAVIAYPDAIYHITVDDVCRAMIHSALRASTE